MNRKLQFDELTGTWLMFPEDDCTHELNIVEVQKVQPLGKKYDFNYVMYEVFLAGSPVEAFNMGVALITEKAGGNPELDYLTKRLYSLEKDLASLESDRLYCFNPADQKRLREHIYGTIQKRDACRLALAKETE